MSILSDGIFKCLALKFVGRQLPNKLIFSEFSFPSLTLSSSNLLTICWCSVRHLCFLVAFCTFFSLLILFAACVFFFYTVCFLFWFFLSFFSSFFSLWIFHWHPAAPPAGPIPRGSGNILVSLSCFFYDCCWVSIYLRQDPWPFVIGSESYYLIVLFCCCFSHYSWPSSFDCSRLWTLIPPNILLVSILLVISAKGEFFFTRDSFQAKLAWLMSVKFALEE